MHSCASSARPTVQSISFGLSQGEDGAPGEIGDPGPPGRGVS